MNLIKFNNNNSDKSPSGTPSLSKIFFLISLFVAMLTVLCLITYIAISDYQHYKAETESLRIKFPEQQKHELKYRILAAKDYIHFVRTHSVDFINAHINNKISKAIDLFNRGKIITPGEPLKIKPEIADSLYLLFLTSKLQIAISDSTGQPVFTSEPDSSVELTNSSIWKRYKEFSATSKSSPIFDGWKYFAQNKQPKCISFGTIPGSNFQLHAVYQLSDSTSLMQELVLDSLVTIRYENGEYIFINTFDGFGLITKGVLQHIPLKITQGQDTNWINIFQKELEFANSLSGNYLNYSWAKDSSSGYSEKVSYISGIADWKWILGTGMHTNDIHPILQARKAELRQSMISKFISLVIFMIVLVLIIYFITRYITNLSSSNIRLFVKFFKNASINLQQIDESQIHFREFQTLAKAANHMISERDRIKTDLETEQSRLKYMIDSIPDMIFFKGTDSLFVGCNRAFEKYIGKKSAEIRGLTEYDLFSKAHADLYTETDRRLMSNLEPIRSTDWVTYPDGRKVLADTLKTLYFDTEGKVLGIIGISRDITEMEETRQRLIMAKEKAEESDRLKTAFLANMSHEIRTPMNAIIGFSDLLSDEDLAPEDREDFISKIKLSGESLMNIINDIIDIAKIEAGQLKITDAECDIDKLLANLYGTFSEIKNRSHKSELELKLNLPSSDTPLVTIADPLRLHQVLTNLLSNALKFTEFGQIEFGYTFKDSIIQFFVRDTGIGILRSKQQLLFQRFSQLDQSTTRKYGGTGLGLAISKNIVELMGGSIWLESEPGQGSLFQFTLPYRAVEVENIAAFSVDDTINWKNKKILIAEDIDQNYILMEAVLKFTQVTLLHAPNGQVAIDLVKEHSDIDLILMDIQLPVKTGYEAIQEILQIYPELPIISFTAYALPREKEKSLEAGCVDFLNKPIKPDQLLNVIRKYMN
ncbi:MAG: cache domain-containing protein [Bacteroidales bacterium]|nr:cache domain-containing protein [Bacteroidales bacterium]